MEYPEHEKLSGIKELSQKLGEILDWMPMAGYIICRSTQREKICPECCGSFGLPPAEDVPCDECNGDRYIPVEESYQFTPAHINIQTLLAEFFEIDLNKLEEEKQAMLASLREAQIEA